MISVEKSKDSQPDMCLTVFGDPQGSLKVREKSSKDEVRGNVSPGRGLITGAPISLGSRSKWSSNQDSKASYPIPGLSMCSSSPAGTTTLIHLYSALKLESPLRGRVKGVTV